MERGVVVITHFENVEYLFVIGEDWRMRSLSHLLSDHKYLPAWMKGGRNGGREEVEVGRGEGYRLRGGGRREGFPRQLLLAPPKAPPTRVEPA